jgi:hypothetical protein
VELTHTHTCARPVAARSIPHCASLCCHHQGDVSARAARSTHTRTHTRLLLHSQAQGVLRSQPSRVSVHKTAVTRAEKDPAELPMHKQLPELVQLLSSSTLVSSRRADHAPDSHMHPLPYRCRCYSCSPSSPLPGHTQTHMYIHCCSPSKTHTHKIIIIIMINYTHMSPHPLPFSGGLPPRLTAPS